MFDSLKLKAFSPKVLFKIFGSFSFFGIASLIFYQNFIPESKIQSSDRIGESIQSGVRFLEESVKVDGRFVYRLNLRSDLKIKPSYNILRHAGTIYALAHVGNQFGFNPDLREAIFKTKGYLIDQSIRPTSFKESLAVWSLPESGESVKIPTAKLGGTALGLIAFLESEKIEPLVDPLVLRKLGNFLVNMQNPDGSFKSKINEEGEIDDWESLYYPGEAALALAMLYERDPDPLWWNASKNSIFYLERARQALTHTEADHWALIATGKIMEIDQKRNLLTESERQRMISHAVQVSESILTELHLITADGVEYVVTENQELCPLATRVEGLIAAQPFLPEEFVDLRNRIQKIKGGASASILCSQVSEGPLKGGFLRKIPITSQNGDSSSRDTELRIDYTQHAICALMGME